MCVFINLDQHNIKMHLYLNNSGIAVNNTNKNYITEWNYWEFSQTLFHYY